jgi:AraC-like DNA-binding protein
VKSAPEQSFVGEDHERIVLARSANLPGVEIKSIFEARRLWRVFHENYAIVSPIAGASCRVFQGESIWRRPGELMLYAPGDFDTNTHFEPGTALHIVSIDPTTLNANWSERMEQSERFQFRTSHVSAPGLARAVDRLATQLHGQRGGDATTAFMTFMESLAPHTIHGSEQSRSQLRRREHRAVARMRDQLQADLVAPFSLDRLAEVAELNKYTALRAFKRHFGTTPHDYRQALRIARARTLLTKHRPSVVGVLLGFADFSHFRRTFIKYVGLSPAQYRTGACSSGSRD